MRFAFVLLAGVLACSLGVGQPPAEDLPAKTTYKLGPDSEKRDGVPAGELVGPVVFKSKAFEGTVRSAALAVEGVTEARIAMTTSRPDRKIVAIGSGGPYAQAAARALYENTDLGPRDIVQRSLDIAGELCIYTNRNIVIETLE